MNFSELADRSNFPSLANNPDLIYADAGSSTPTHGSVLAAMNEYYEHYRANTGRGEYALAERATDAIADARIAVAKFMGCESENILFTSGTTHALNNVAQWYKDVPQVIVSETEHNANIVPWLMQGRSKQNGRLAVIPVADNGHLNYAEASEILTAAPAGSLMSITACSNVSGVKHDMNLLMSMAHHANVRVGVDAAQDIITRPRWMKYLQNIEYVVYSGHKILGPTGVGVMYTRCPVDELRALSGGGGARQVTFNDVAFNNGTGKHEVGTQNIAGIIGMGKTAELLDFMVDSMPKIYYDLGDWGNQHLADIPGLTPIIKRRHEIYESSIMTFVPTRTHSSDIAAMLRHTDLACRTGRLCAHPYVDKISNLGVVRLSFGPYNTENDIKRAGEILRTTMKKLT
jgi:selenocysteine lyase/cysteine desulfurase